MTALSLIPSIPNEDTLLMEENAIDPRTPLPSFVEMTFVDASILTAQKALQSSIHAIITYMSPILFRNSIHLHPSRNPDHTSLRRFINLLRSKICHILFHLGRYYPTELRCFLTFWIERRYLNSKACASLAESLYAMRRSKVVRRSDQEGVHHSSFHVYPLSDHDRRKALIILVLLPYLKEKLDTWYEKERDQLRRDSVTLGIGPSQNDGQGTLRLDSFTVDNSLTEGRLQNGSNDVCPKSSSSFTNNVLSKWDWSSFHAKLKNLFVITYPYLHMTHEGFYFAYRFAYLIGRSIHYSPYSHMIGQIVRRETIEDRSEESRRNPMSSTGLQPSGNTIVVRSTNALRSVLRLGILCAGFSYCFAIVTNDIRKNRRRWMASMTHRCESDASFSDAVPSSMTTTDSNCIPPPPQPPQLLPSSSIHSTLRNALLPDSKTICPICRQHHLNPVATSSGYVFCYRCIVMHLREHGPKCPLTGLPCSELDLVRLYEPVVHALMSRNVNST